jgi:hypothetical protein
MVARVMAMALRVVGNGDGNSNGISDEASG